MGVAWGFSGIAVPALWAAALTFVGYDPPELFYARGCFILGGVILAGVAGVWIVKSWPLDFKRAAVALALYVVAVGVPTWGMVWIGAREAKAQVPPTGINNNTGIVTFGQSGGTNVQFFNGKPVAAITPETIASIQRAIPAGSAISIGKALQDEATDKTANDLKEALTEAGYHVEPEIVTVLGVSYFKGLRLAPKNGDTFVIWIGDPRI